MASERPRRLTPKVRALVATDRQARPPVGRLTSAQVEVLKAIARREHEFAEPVSAPRAISALAAGASADVAVPVLETLLSNSKAPRTDRITAARGLGHIATPEAEQALLQNVRARDPRVQQDVLAALGMFAGPAAARQLGKLVAPLDPATRQQLALTRALIAHRHGLDGPFLPEARVVERRAGRPEQMTTLELRTKTAKTTAAALDRLRGSTYGIEFTDRAYSLRCGPTEWAIFINKEMGRSPTSLTHIFDRPWIAAILAQWLPEREAATTRFVMLTRPRGERVDIDVVRADGELVYTGTAEQVGSAIAFAISDVDRLGTAPMNIAGRITSRGVELETRVVFASRIGVRETVAVA